MKGELAAPKNTNLNLVHDELTVGICGVTEPEEADVISITLMEVNMKKGFFNISVVVCMNNGT